VRPPLHPPTVHVHTVSPPRSSFREALDVTSKAKARFAAAEDDLYERGKRLIKESIECGVTAMRAHVEVDRTVRFTCLAVAQRLQAEFANLCDVQIAGAPSMHSFYSHRARAVH